MVQPQQLPPLLLLLSLLLLLHCPLLKGYEKIEAPANRTDTRENCSHVFLVLHDSDNYTLDNHLAQWIQGDYYFNGLLNNNFSRPVMCAYPPEFSLTSRDLAILITAMSITSISIFASMALMHPCEYGHLHPCEYYLYSVPNTEDIS